MSEFFDAAQSLAWPMVVALAWVVGEIGHRYTGLPRISLYGLVGFVAAPSQLGWLPASVDGSWALLANVAFGLILFEFGYRINLRWLRLNGWIGATALAEAAMTFIAVFAVSRLFGSAMLTALLLASLAMSTSPAAVMRVVNEQRSAGQVTERVLHLAAANCVLTLLVFKIIVGFWAYDTSGSLWRAASSSVLVLAASAAIGAGFGIAVPQLLRRMHRLGEDATVAFALAVILIVALTHAFKLSPLLATLTFGIVARHRRVALNPTQRNFGALGDLLTVILFIYVATTIEWPRVIDGILFGAALLAVRLLTKVLGVALFAQASGVSWRKGICTGLALTPISVFVILLLEQTRYLGINLLDQLAPLAAATLILEIFGPLVSQFALRAAGETRETRPR